MLFVMYVCMYTSDMTIFRPLRSRGAPLDTRQRCAELKYVLKDNASCGAAPLCCLARGACAYEQFTNLVNEPMDVIVTCAMRCDATGDIFRYVSLYVSGAMDTYRVKMRRRLRVGVESTSSRTQCRLRGGYPALSSRSRCVYLRTIQRTLRDISM